MTPRNPLFESDLFDAEGNLERPVGDGGWHSPNLVTLDDTEKWLLWGDMQPGRRWMAERHPGPGMLEQFISLSNARPRQVLAYARRWGILMKCEHGRSFALARVIQCHPCQRRFTVQLDEVKPLLREKVDLWRQYASEFKALLAISIALRNGERGTKEDWSGIKSVKRTSLRGELKTPEKWSIHRQQMTLQDILQHWCHKADVQILFQWQIDGMPFIILGGSLLAALVIQLMLVISRSSGIAFCDACGRPFAPTRKPNPNRRKFCTVCGHKAACRYAKRDERQRNRNLH